MQHTIHVRNELIHVNYHGKQVTPPIGGEFEETPGDVVCTGKALYICNVLTLYIFLFRSSLRIKHGSSVFSKHYTGDEERIESTKAH